MRKTLSHMLGSQMNVSVTSLSQGRVCILIGILEVSIHIVPNACKFVGTRSVNNYSQFL